MESTQPVHIYRQMLSIVRLARTAYSPYKREIAILTVLGLVGGILEGIGINAVIPLLTFMLGLQNPATDMLSRAIQTFFAFIHVPFVPKYLLSFIVLLFLGKAAVTLLLGRIQVRITTEYERKTRAKLFEKVLNASWPYLLKQKLGNLETLLMIDTPCATSLLVKISFSILIATNLIMYLLVAFSISALVTLTTFALGALTFITLRPLLDRVHDFSRDRAVLYRDTLHHVTEHVSGLKTVKALGVEKAAIEKGNTLFEGIKVRSAKIQILQQVAGQAVAPIGVLYIAGILSLAFKTPFISLAALPSILYLVYRIFTYVQQMQNNVQYMSELAPHLERVVFYESDAESGAADTSGNRPFRFEKELSFNNVSFAYTPGRDVLRDMSFKVPKGSLLGIVGPSGAGKTTCIDLLLRLLVPAGGSITIDGVDIQTISLENWRNRVGYVSQEPFIIHDTIRNNVRFYDQSVSDSEIWEAAKKAHIEEFIKKLPEGLNTVVGSRGISISAGERQRIVIARALARKPELLILDEATSALDNESEAHIKRVIEDLKGKITIIAIAHRLSTIMGSDLLVALKDGTVVEIGRPQELLRDSASYFSRVYSINA